MKKANLKSTTYPKTGPWVVSTEGDCEGRSRNELGIFEGTIPEVLKQLFELGLTPYYKYYFTPYQKPVPTPKTVAVKPYPVDVSFADDVASWGLSQEDRVKLFQEFTGDQAVVTKGQAYGSARIDIG